MTPCSGCQRHLRLTDTSCPFCGSRVSVAGRALHAVGGAVTALVLAACYGGPPDGNWKDTGNETGILQDDVDGDGATTETDCNDNDATINPAAAEVCDDTVDNDCDEKIDAADEDCAAAR